MEGDGLPNTICQKCITKLNIAWQFKMQCESSDAKLRQFYMNSQHLQVPPDLDIYSVRLKTDGDMYLIKQPEPNPTQFNLDIITTVENPQEEKSLEDDKYTEKKNKKATSRQKSDRNKEFKVHQCDTCGKTFNRREYLTQHIRIHTGMSKF